jgi:signal transduction histidine kinase
MLARWNIRTKLLGALILLSLLVGILSFGGQWGVYGYRHLAVAVSERAAELPLGNELTRNADKLKDAVDRIRREQPHTNGEAVLIDRHAVRPWQQYENEIFQMAVGTYRTALAKYREHFEQSLRSQTLLTDHRAQLAVLDELEHQLEQIDSPRYAELYQLDAAELNELHLLLQQLGRETEKLPRFLQERMAGFRDQVRGQYRTMIVAWWVGTIGALGLMTLLLLLFRQTMVRPFRCLLEGSRLVARGNLDHRIEMRTGDEFEELAEAMNSMTNRFQRTYDELDAVCHNLDKEVRDRTREVVQREQLASVGFLAAGVAHEINNPLASIAWSAEALESRLHDLLHGCDAASASDGDAAGLSEDQRESLHVNLRRIQEEAFRCKGITERLLDFSRMGDLRKSPTDLVELVSDVVAMVGTLGQYRCKAIEIRSDVKVRASVNAQQIKQVVLNLLTNALESLDKDGRVVVHVLRHEDRAKIVVTDNGCGMTAEVLENLFEPFFTRRLDGRGTGLGLSITYRIVNQHGGQLTAHSDGPGTGARLEVSLPVKSNQDVEQENEAVAA